MLASKGAPSGDLVSITPSDGDSFTKTRALYVGGAGDLRVQTEAGQDVTIPSVKAGVMYPFIVTKVYATGTTASGIVAVY